MFENSKAISMYPGERVQLSKATSYMVGVKKGRIEVYIKSTAGDKSFFLMEIQKNETIFPMEAADLDVVLYALEDSEICEITTDTMTEPEIAECLQKWYKSLMNLPFIKKKIADNRGQRAYWQDIDERIGSMEPEDLFDFWTRHRLIIAGEIRGYFSELGSAKAKRVTGREHNEQKLLDASINNLLQRDIMEPVEDDNVSQGKITYVVCMVAKALDMPTDNINLSAHLAKRLDQAGLIKRLIQKGNMNMRLVKLEDGWYKHDVGVMIGYAGEDKSLVALIPETENSYKMYSLDNQEGTLIDEVVAATIDKDAFQCYGGFPSRKLTIGDLARFMFKHCWKRDYKTIIACSLVAGFIPLASPIITETIFSDIIPIRDFVGLAAVTQIMMVAGFTSAALGLVRAIATLRITNHLDMYVEAAIWGRLLRLPANFFRRFESGELLQRINGIESIKELVSGEFVTQVFNLIFSFWSIGLMLWYSWKLTLEALIVWALYILVVIFVYRRVIHFQRELLQASNKTAGLVQQIFNGLAKFRVHGAETQAFYRWSKIFGEEWKWNMKLRWQGNYNGIIGAIQPFILSMLLYYTAMYGMTEVTATGQVVHNMSYPQFLAFQSAFVSFNGTITGIIPLVAKFFTIKPHIENLRPILDEVPEVTDDKIDADVLNGAIKMEHLAFSYGPDLPEVLKDINLNIKPGEYVAIVGRSGSGKSTLLRLLLGMEKPKKGGIYYDGQDLQELNLSSVRSQLGVVLQNGQLMTGDIFSNIVGTTPLTIDDAWNAARLVGIAEDIEEMPMGMHTIISEGSSNISGGQRQRILIARALVGDPAIVMLDEATSALDNRTQSIVTDSLSRMKATRIVVAHRLSTIRNVDRIILIDNGVVAEEGTFDELMELNGIFAGLARRQLA